MADSTFGQRFLDSSQMDAVQIAFKEWAVVVEAIGSGRQIVILRKGGIAEGVGGFKAEHDRFWLFPTRFHQQAKGVIDSEAALFTRISFPAEDVLSVEYACEVAAVKQLNSLELANRLKGQHIWRDTVISERFDWGRDLGIYAMAVRVRRLPEPVKMPMLESYGGCKSWVELNPKMEFAATQYVLDEAAFIEKLEAFEEALE